MGDIPEWDNEYRDPGEIKNFFPLYFQRSLRVVDSPGFQVVLVLRYS
jgi:hypothetical protein